MMEENQNIEIRFDTFLRNILTNKILFLKTTLFFFIIGFLVAIFSKSEYTSVSSFTPNLSQGSSINSGSIGGLAAMAGINLDKISNDGGGNISPMLYPEIFNSIPFKVELIEKKIDFVDYDIPISYKDYTLSNSFTNPLKTIRKYLSSFFSKDFYTNKVDSNLIQISNETYSVIKKVNENIQLGLNSKEGSIHISSTMNEPVASAQLAFHAQEILQKYIIELKIKKAQEDLEYIEKRLIEKELDFKSIQKKFADYKDKNQNLSSEIAKTKLKFLESEYDLAYQLYSDLSSQMESKKLKVKESTPVFTMLSPATVPNQKSNLSKLSIIIIFLIIGAVISVFRITYSSYLNKIFSTFNTK
jgi:uncharacterized protein involved in exopolysaccharide biosynthesis